MTGHTITTKAGRKVRGTTLRGRQALIRGCVAAAAALTVIGAVPTGAVAESFPVYQAKGAAVKGTATSDQAPTLKQPGLFKDTIAPGEKKYYAVPLDDVSSAYLSVFALPKPGAQVKYSDGTEIKLESASGTDCNTATPTFGSDNSARPIGDYVSRKMGADQGCQEAGNYLLSVTRKSDGTSDPAAWPIEIRYMSEPGLKKGTSPEPVAPAGSATPPAPSGEAEQVKGGTGFNDATALKTKGVFKDSVQPGQTLFYRVPVDWGQRLFTTTEFANGKVTDDSGYTTNGVRVEVYNPARGWVTAASQIYSGEQAAVQTGTWQADYKNRFDSDGQHAAMRLSGWYYLAVSVNHAVGDFTDGPVGFTLRVLTEGTKQQGPQYDGDPAKSGLGVSEDAFGDGSGLSTGKKVLAVVGFGGGGLLLIGLVTWLMLRSRRRADAVPAGAAPGYAPGPDYGPGYGADPGQEPQGPQGPGGW